MVGALFFFPLPGCKQNSIQLGEHENRMKNARGFFLYPHEYEAAPQSPLLLQPLPCTLLIMRYEWFRHVLVHRRGKDKNPLINKILFPPIVEEEHPLTHNFYL
ncbi:hypothetical protein ABEI85_22010 [Peribacillus castrilensis]